MKIIGFTGSRADYYLQQPLFKKLSTHPSIKLSIIVSGSILEESSKSTISDIHKDGIKIQALVPLPHGDTGTTHSLQISGLIPQIESIISSENFDIALVYADRYESFAFALCAFHNDLVVAHLEAGDITNGGTYDDNIRHCITKMSHLQFTSTQLGLKAVRSMGEEKWRSASVGLLSYESFSTIQKDDALRVSTELHLSHHKPLVICTMHPVPSSIEKTTTETRNLLRALADLSISTNVDIIFTGPNRDQGCESIRTLIKEWQSEIQGFTFIESLGGYRYHALMSLASSKCVIICGNSSSVIKEAPFYSAHGLNIGSRQNGREKADSQVDVPGSYPQILNSLKSLCEQKCNVTYNPYLGCKPSETIVELLLKNFEQKGKKALLQKRWEW